MGIKKRGRGRPKGSKNKTSVLKSSTECFPLVEGGGVKRGRGRPRKERKEVLDKNETKVGSSKKESIIGVEPIEMIEPIANFYKKSYPRNAGNAGNAGNADMVDMSNVRCYKFLGYCIECFGMISSGDLEEGKKTIYVCKKCKYRGNVGHLYDEIIDEEAEEKITSKKAFLEETLIFGEDHHTSIRGIETEIPEEFNDIEYDLIDS